MKTTHPLMWLAIGLLACALGSSAQALEFDQNVTPDVIFGSGNANGGFTVVRQNGVELGLRAKLRYDNNCEPTNTFNSNGDGSYSFEAGVATNTGTGINCVNAQTPRWSFEWSVNTNWDDSEPGRNLNALSFEMGLDREPGFGTDFFTFNPVVRSLTRPPTVSNWYGTNATGNGGGSTTSPASANNVAQNSWQFSFSYGLFSNPMSGFDPTVEGRYTLFLRALDGSDELARVGINVIVGNPPAPDVVYVDDAYDVLAPGTPVQFSRPGFPVADAIIGIDAFSDLQAAIDAVAAGGEIFVRGTHLTTGQVLIDKDLHIQGADPDDRPVISPIANLTGGNAADAWFLVDAGVEFSLTDVILDGDTRFVWQGLRNHGNTTIQGVSFLNIQGSLSGVPYRGTAVASFGGIVGGGAGQDSHGGPGLAPASLVVNESSFEQIGRIGILIKGTASTATISGNVFTGKGEGDFIDYAVEVGASGSAVISNNIITGNRGIAASDGSGSAGILVTTFFGGGPPSSAEISDNLISDNLIGVSLGFNAADDTDTELTGNEFQNNGTQLRLSYPDFDLVEDALDDNAFDRAVVVRDNPIVVPTIFSSIQAAINSAAAGQLIDIQEGVYPELITIDKALTVTGVGPDTVIDGGMASANAIIAIPSNQTGVTIRDLRVQNVLGTCIRGGSGNNNTLIDSVQVDNCDGPGAGGGIYFDGPVDNITITNSEVSNATWRSIVVWNGFKTNITITDNIVAGNGGLCCGIELQDGSASGVTITGNTVTGHGDSGISAVGLTSGAGPNLIAGNTVTDNGRFGIEIKNPDGTGGLDETADGAIVVRDNMVSLTGPISDSRDTAGIAVFRRGVLAGNPDIPTGVIVHSNTVSGFTQTSLSDGFGIVVEGLDMRVFANQLTANDVGIQRQSGHLPYPGDGDQSNLDDDYFGRGNSPVVCALVENNTFSGNGIDERTVVQAGAADAAAVVTNIDTGNFYCSIQDAIDSTATLDDHTLQLASATYRETVVVDKSLTIIGDPDGLDRPVVTWSDTLPSGEETLIRVAAQNVTIDGLDLQVDQTYVGEAIRTVGDAGGLIVRNNRIVASASDPGSLVGFGIRNAIAIDTLNRAPVQNGFSATIQDNVIEADPAGVGIAGFFRAGIAMDTSTGSISGNDILTWNHDILARFTLGGNLEVSGNTSRGGGIQLAEFNATGPVTVSGNEFLPGPDFIAFLGASQSSLRLHNNVNSIPVTVSDNIFTGHATGIRAENFPALSVADNSFAPTDAVDYRHIVVSNRVNVTNYLPPLEINIAIDGNDFGSSTADGIALVFDNNNCCNPPGSGTSVAAFGDLRVGGVAPNSFDGGLTQYVVLDDSTGVINVPPFAETEAQPFSADVNAIGNIWDGVAGADQTAAQRQATRDRIVDRFVNTDLGEVILEGQDSLTLELIGLAASYAPGDSQSGDELARFSYDIVAGSIDQIFNVFTILDASGNPISAALYDELFVSFTTDPADYIRSLSGTTVANVVAPDSIDVSLLFELQPDAPFGEYELVLTSFDVTGVDPIDVNLTDALAGEYFVLDSVSQLVRISPDTVFVDDDYAGLSSGDPVVFNHPELAAPVNATFGLDAFATVPAGLSAVSDGGLVLVADGQYPGGNLSFDRSQRLIGAGADGTVLGSEEGNYPVGRLGNVVVGSDNVEIASLQIHGYDAFRIDTTVGGVENIVIRDNRLRKSNQHGIVVDGRNWRITENVIEDAGQVLAHLGILGGFLDFAEDILVRGNTIRGSAASGVFIQGGPGIVLLNNDIEDNGGFGAASSAQAFMAYNRSRSVPNAALDVRTADSVVLCNQILANADNSASRIRATNSDAFVSLNALFDDGAIDNTGSGQLDATENWWETAPVSTGDVLVDPELDAFEDYLALCFPTPSLTFAESSIVSGDTVALTVVAEKPFAISSAGFDLALEGIVFDVPLPPEFVVTLDNDGCGGASLDSNVLMVTDATLAAGVDSCEIELSVTVVEAGLYEIFSSEFFSLETGLGGVPGEATLEVEPAAADVFIDDLLQTFNGAPRPVTVTTDPAGLNVIVTYDGSTTPPTDAGSYTVVATIDEANFAGEATDTLVVEQAEATVLIDDLLQPFDGTPRAVTVTTDPAGLDVIVTYDGSTTPPTDVGSYEVIATVDDNNYFGSATATLVVEQAEATVLIEDLLQPFDGTLRVVTVTTVPAGLDVVVTYDGSTTPPTDAGSYEVIATVDDSNYFGSATATLVVEPAEQTIDFAPLPDLSADSAPFTLMATATSGLTVEFELISGPATLAGNEVTLTGDLGTVVIEATQPGDDNWQPAEPVQRSFLVTAGVASRIEAASSTSITGVPAQPVAPGDLPTVRVVDSFDNPVAGVTVGFELISGNGTLFDAVGQTDSDGLFQLGGWTLGAAANQEVRAEAPGLVDSPVSFIATVGRVADLRISIDDNRASILAGESNTYFIEVVNNGPSGPEPVRVSVPLPAQLDAATADWICLPSPGASCTAAGTGPIDDVGLVPVNGSLIYLLQVDVRPDASGEVVVAATLEVDEEVVVVDEDALSDSDTTQIIVDQLFRDRFEKAAQGGPESPMQIDAELVEGFLQWTPTERSQPEPLQRLLHGVGRANVRVLDLTTVSAHDQQLMRLSLRGADGSWSHSPWQALGTNEREFAFLHDELEGLMLLAGLQVELIVQLDGSAAPLRRLIPGPDVTLQVDD